VAREIVSALQSPRFDVFVPRSTGAINKVVSMLPRSGREAMSRWLKADRILVERDAAERRAYEDRAAHSDPHQAEEREQDTAQV
jgi:hypothetical protein